MKILVEKYPQWSTRGSIVHGLALAMKDFTTFTAGRGQNAKHNSWGYKWAEIALAAANKIANYLNDIHVANTLMRTVPWWSCL